MNGSAALPLVFVTVGTDHHPFDRLVRWVDAWLSAGPADRVRCVVQFGTSTTPSLAEARQYLPYDELEALMGEATAVVCHGGPGSVMAARWRGTKPIVVPRRHGRGEHVDDHQLVFSRRMAAEGEILLVEEESDFRRVLDGVLDGSVSLDLPAARADVTISLERFEELVDGLFAGGGRRR
jgi:UDP-N-acetylglucosamine transferase subunit ALG13